MNKKFLERLGFTPCFDVISRVYPKNVDRVLGKIWRYCQMSQGVCNASLGRIAKELGISYSTVERAMSILLSENLVNDLTPNLKNHPHSYTVNEGLILELESTQEELLIQNDVVLVQNEGATHSNPVSHSFNLNDEDTENLRKESRENSSEPVEANASPVPQEKDSFLKEINLSGDSLDVDQLPQESVAPTVASSSPEESSPQSVSTSDVDTSSVDTNPQLEEAKRLIREAQEFRSCYVL